MKVAFFRTSSVTTLLELIHHRQSLPSQKRMPAESALPSRPHLRLQHSRPLSLIIPSQHVSSPAARGSAPATRSARPRREAATIARKRVEDTYALYPFEQNLHLDSDATSTIPSVPRRTSIHSDDSSDGDAFVDDSESDCPRPRKAALERKRKRSASPVIDVGERRRVKAGKSWEMDDRTPKEAATGFMVKNGNVMKDILLGEASRTSRTPLSGPEERVHSENWGHYVRRAGLSDMGPVTGSYMSNWRDEVWTNAAEEFGLESRKSVAKGPVDGDGYRVSRFCEHL